MLQADRPEFETQFRKLCAGANVPATDERIEAYWTGLAKMPLPDMVRAVNHLLGLEEWSFPKKPGSLWAIVRELKAQQRAPGAPAAAAPVRIWHGDKWDSAANNHLLAHFVRQTGRGVHYASKRMRGYPMPEKADQESIDLVFPLIEAKNAWAADMRDLDENRASLPDHGRALWQEYVDVAEQRIARIRAQSEQREAA